MKKRVKKTRVDPPPLSSQERLREAAKLALTRAVKREKTIGVLSRRLEREIVKRNYNLRAIARFITIQLMDRATHEALDRSEEPAPV